MTDAHEEERLRRWRLALGDPEDASGRLTGLTEVSLDKADRERDRALGALYDGGPRRAGLGGSAPRVARWLGDIRTYFPSSVVHVLQRDALDRFGLADLLVEPEMLAAVQPDLALVTALIALRDVIPPASREAARAVVRQVTDELESRLTRRTQAAVTGALARTARSRRPRPADIDWLATIGANLRHYQPDLGTIIPERLVGHGRLQRAVQRRIILAIDQSGSMAPSVVHAGVLGSVLAGLRAIRTHVVAFDTSVVDLTDVLEDPVDLLFALQLGGGTDINAAVSYVQTLVTDPTETVVVLLSDLYEGGVRDELLRRARDLLGAGVTVICLLALSDEGTPAFDHQLAGELVGLGATALACTPDTFPDLMAAAIERRDLGVWAADRGLAAVPPA